MDRVKATDDGIEIVFGGPLSREEAEDVLAELRRKLPPAGGRFGVLVDSRGAREYPAASQEVFKRAIFLCLERGMERSVVVHDSPVASFQARRLAIETGTLLWTRYIDADSRPDWRRAARAWLIDAIDPDLA